MPFSRVNSDGWINYLTLYVEELDCVEIVVILRDRGLRCNCVCSGSNGPDLSHEYIQICLFVSYLVSCKAFWLLVSGLTNFYRFNAPFWTTVEGHCRRWCFSSVTLFRKNVSEVFFELSTDRRFGIQNHVSCPKFKDTSLSFQSLVGFVQTFHYLTLDKRITFTLFLAKLLLFA